MSIYYNLSNLKRAYGESILPYKISFFVIAKDDTATIEKCINLIIKVVSLFNDLSKNLCRFKRNEKCESR